MKTHLSKTCLQVFLFMSLILGAALPPQSVLAAPLCVEPSGAGGCFTTIQAAVDAAVAGDVITVQPGTYDGTINIDGRTDITLDGADVATTIVMPSTTLDWNVETYGSSRKTVLRVASSTGITIQDLTFDLDLVKGNAVYAALLWNSTGSLTGNTFKNNLIPDTSGGYTEGSVYLKAPGYTDAARAAVNVSGNTFADVGRVSLLIHDFVNATIDDNEIYRTVDDFGYGIELGSESSGTITNNVIYGFDTPAASDGSESGGVYIENAFTDTVVDPVTKNVTISNNEVYGSQWALHIGNEFDGFAGNVDINVTVSTNNFHDNLVGGIAIADEDKAAGSSVTASFSGNSVLNSSGGYGYYIYTLGDGEVNVNIQGDTISGNNVGVYMYEAAGPGASTYNVTVQRSLITGNTTYGVQNEFAGAVINASPNYWGALSGPGGVGSGTGNAVSANVIYDPWYTNVGLTTLNTKVTLIGPEGNIGSVNDPTYEWNDVGNAGWYQLGLADSIGNAYRGGWIPATGICSESVCSALNSTMLSTLPTLPGGTYTWYIRGRNLFGSWSWSAPMVFTVEDTLVCYALTLGHTGQGSDPVADPTNSTGCPTGQYVAGQNIDLSDAMPDAGWEISGWSGTANDSSTADINSLTMPASTHTASVNYSQNEYALTIVSAHGTVTKSPDQTTYHYGDEVTLSVTTDPGWTFTGWTPSLTGNKVTITANTTVTANYSQNEYTLTIDSAHGTVTKDPDQATYHYGDEVTLSVTADPGWTFTGWGGDCSGAGTCIITMNANKSVTAIFAVDSLPTVLSIVRASANPTSAASVDFVVTFSEPVTGVDANDFALAATSLTGASIASVSGSDATWTVTVNTGSGRGFLRLDVPVMATITDLTGNPLDNLPFMEGQVYTIGETSGAGIYDDRHAGWIYTGSWARQNATGPYQGTFSYTSAAESMALFPFNGNKFKLYYTQYTNRGEMDVYIDDMNTPVATINANGPLVWQQSWTSDTLPTAGVHVVMVKYKSGTYIDVDAIQIFSPIPEGMYDDRHSGWIYAGTWALQSATGPYQGTFSYASTTNSTASFTFDGVQFKLYYTQYTNRGEMEVYIDDFDTPVHTIDANGALAWQQSWTSGPLPPGVHTVMVKYKSGTMIDVDAIQIFGPPDAVKPSPITTLGAATGTANGTANLTWTAVGDDGNVGTASSYLVRYSTAEISDETAWTNATPVTTGIPTPKAAGQAESMVVNGLGGGTYYFAVRAQDEGANLGDLSNSPFAVANAPVPLLEGTYDDRHTTWQYSGSWAQQNATGPYKGTFTYSQVANDSATLTFEGIKVTLYYTQYTNRGVMNIYIDDMNNPVATINANGSLVWQKSWTSNTLPAGVHTVKIVHVSGTYIDVDAIRIMDPVPAGTYDDRHADWRYTGSWNQQNATGPYKSTFTYSQAVNDSATFTFEGSQLTLYYTQYTNRGEMDIYIDDMDTPVARLDANGALVWQKSWTSDPLTPGVHTLKIVHVSGTYIDVDAIKIE